MVKTNYKSLKYNMSIINRYIRQYYYCHYNIHTCHRMQNYCQFLVEQFISINEVKLLYYIGNKCPEYNTKAVRLTTTYYFSLYTAKMITSV